MYLIPLRKCRVPRSIRGTHTGWDKTGPLGEGDDTNSRLFIAENVYKSITTPYKRTTNEILKQRKMSTCYNFPMLKSNKKQNWQMTIVIEDFWQINWQSRPFIDFYCLSMIDFIMARKLRSELEIQKKNCSISRCMLLRYRARKKILFVVSRLKC